MGASRIEVARRRAVRHTSSPRRFGLVHGRRSGRAHRSLPARAAAGFHDGHRPVEQLRLGAGRYDGRFRARHVESRGGGPVLDQADAPRHRRSRLVRAREARLRRHLGSDPGAHPRPGAAAAPDFVSGRSRLLPRRCVSDDALPPAWQQTRVDLSARQT